MSQARWALTTLGEVADLYQGFGFPKALQGKSSGDLAFYKVSDISRAVLAGRETLGDAVHYISSVEAQKLRATPIPKDSVVFARIGEAINLNRRAVLPAPSLVDNNVIGVKARSGVEDRYLFYFLKTIKLGELSQATTVPAVRTSDIERIAFPLAPTSEQRRIVSRLDELLSRIEEGERALERVQKLVERYRQSVLKAAVTGELTRDWREKTQGQLESGESLLGRLLNARREAWEKAELDKLKAKGITPANDKWKQKYEEPTRPDTTELPELPEGWAWASLEQIAAPEGNAITDGPFGSNLKTEHYTDSGPRVIRLQNIKDGRFADERAHISHERFDQLQKHRVFAGDLLMAALGESLPRVCIAPDDLGPAIVKADCIRFKPSSQISAQCLTAFLNSPPARHRTKATIHGVGRPRLNLDEIRSLVVPVPSVEEQRAITDAIAIQTSTFEHLRLDAERGLTQLKRLRQSILAQAFNGELVPQHATDEPAMVLLEHIAAKCTVDSAIKPKRGRKSKSEETA